MLSEIIDLTPVRERFTECKRSHERRDYEQEDDATV